MPNFTCELTDEAATLALGKRLATSVQPGLVIYLHGDLGAGKTTLVRGLIQGLGHVGKVKSPTYTLVEPYVISGMNLYHFDLYRFVDPEEWDASGFRDYFNRQSVCLVEWPERASGLLPKADIDIRLEPQGPGRKVVMTANTDTGIRSLEAYLDK
ncbi:MAG TPA: tRNA (adenosine(37)-N6)-threonylcarbamoyltransferase complex ATPase subunit type 1 TsaE [Methylophilaceae bacterium]|nr:tRNA (adenosine(37)-N6)-threonylcarbamoyltransferase complex ATPase subunit type 1 TsaE [Methylophilaceae bacterium]